MTKKNALVGYTAKLGNVVATEIMTNSRTRLLLFTFLIVGIYGCSSTKKVVEAKVEKMPVSFDYAPISNAKVGTAKITVAIVNPTFAGNDYNNSIFQQFSKSMGKDFEELLTSKGITIRGPFETRGEMLYNDKQNSDFILEPQISFDFTNFSRSKLKKVQKPSIGELMVNKYAQATVSYMYSGKGTYNSNLSMVFKSTNYTEKIDVKSFPIEGTVMDYNGVEYWQDDDVTFFQEIKQDNVVYNTFVKTLMDQYATIFAKLEKQIEVEYLETIKEQAHKIDKKN
jgi:hypothetical protein